MSTTIDDTWLDYDLHGLLGLRVQATTPAADRLQVMLGTFAVDREVPEDVVVRADLELMLDAAVMGDDIVHNASAVHFRRRHVQVVREGDGYHLNGRGPLDLALVPVLDLAMPRRGAAMVHAASIGYRGRAIALPAAPGTGMSGTLAALAERPGYSVIGDAWAFLTTDGRLLGFGPPLSSGRRDRSDHSSLWGRARLPLVASAGSRPWDHLTRGVPPRPLDHGRPADRSRRALQEAPLLMAAFVERYEGARTRVAKRDREWMAQRLLGDFVMELPRFSQNLLTGLAATSHLSLAPFLEEKARVVEAALASASCFLVQVPSVYDPGVVADEVVRAVEDLLRSLVAEGKAPPGVTVA